MRFVKKFESFVGEELVSTKPVTSPSPTITPTETPTVPRPTRPGVTPIETPSEEDSPMAAAEKVIDRLEYVYSKSSDKDKKEIDSYFKK
jgi:hypothetical protein